MPETNTNNKRTAPAEGERRAVGGLSPQYHVSASIILRHLKRRTLEWIRLADPKAGCIDDLQLGSPNRVDGYQVKWSQLGRNFSFRDLTKASKKTPSLIHQLADGWTRLKQINPSRRVVVHLITNNRPSPNDSPPIGGITPTPNNFASFLAQTWSVAKISDCPSDSVPSDWQTAWMTLSEASGLNKAEFNSFIKDCELEFDFRLPDISDDFREHTDIQQDVLHIAHTLFDVVADRAKIIELSVDQLFERLGWRERVEFRSRHEFPVEQNLYNPITTTVQQLEEAIHALPGGYIILLGSPGSGKSTLLTQTLRYRQSERIIRYYAYVPESQDPNILRGESVNFLHDIVLAIEKAGFQVRESMNRLDRSSLLGRFHEQLGKLHQDWQETGRKTIILIDGLDHIEREQKPQRSLLQDLPEAVQIPDGVYIILGSQTDNLGFPSSVDHAIKQSNHRIEIQPLTREAVFTIVKKVTLRADVKSEHKERIFQLCSGHPLALRLLLNRLQENTSLKEFEQLLEGSEEFTGNIESYYHSYWCKIDNDDRLAHLFGLLARVRGMIDLTWFESWYNGSVILRLRRTAYEFFKREENNRWYFFHNSFRVFILNKSREIPPDIYDPEFDYQFHRELAEQYSHSPEGSTLKWEELYHRIAAKEHDIVLQRVTQTLFRNQFFEYRHFNAIQTDIQLSLQSAFEKHDIVALCRLIFAGAELAQRAFHLDSDILPTLFLNMRDFTHAVEHIRSGNHLRVGSRKAIELSHNLYLAGYVDEARNIFQLAEPLDILSGTEKVQAYLVGDNELLTTWSRVAIFFRDIKEIISCIRHIRIEEDSRINQDVELRSKGFHNRLVYRVGLSLLDQRDWKELQNVIAEFNIQDNSNQYWWLWLHIHAWKKCISIDDFEKARYFLTTVINNANNLSFDNYSYIAIVEAYLHILKDKDRAKKWFEQVTEPKLQKGSLRVEDGIDQFMARFRYARLAYFFGETRDPYSMIPDEKESHYQGILLFERAICVIAKIWADSWSRIQHNPTEIDREVFPLLRFFNRDFSETSRWISWHNIQLSAADFYGLLIKAISLHGSKSLETLRKAFEKEWGGKETGQHWRMNVRRDIVLHLFRFGVSKIWVVQNLQEIEQKMLVGEDVSGRINTCKQQAEAWIELNDFEKAKRSIDLLLHVTFGVRSEKDYQMESWIEWLQVANQHEPESIVERISWFARAIVSLEEQTAGGGTHSAACNLLEATFAFSPRRCMSLFEWFYRKNITGHSGALYSILKTALQTTDPPILHIQYSLCDFFLPFIGERQVELFGDLINCVGKTNDSGSVIALAQYMISKIEIYALPEIRPHCRNSVAEALRQQGIDIASVGLQDEDLVIDSHSSGSSAELTLLDGTKLSHAKAEERASTPAGLIELLQNTANESYFHWHKIVEKIMNVLKKEDVRTLSTLFQGRNRESQVLAILCNRLTSLGATKESWLLGEKALATSEPLGWNIHYDGGSRLTAFQALKRIDEKKAYSMAFETLVSDLTGKYYNPESNALHLNNILLVLTDKIPVVQVWQIVFNYVQILFDEIPLTDDILDIIEKPSQDTAERALVDLLMLFVNHPINVLAQTAQKIIAKLLLDHDHYTQDAIIEMLEGNYNEKHEAILIILDAVCCQDENSVRFIEHTLNQLHSSQNHLVRNLIKKLWKKLNCEEPLNPPPQKDLSPIYSFALTTKGTGLLIDRRDITSTQVIPDSDNPIETVQPFANLYLDIAEEANLPFVNVCYRAVQIMKELSPHEKWNAEGECSLKDHLKDVGLRLMFNRPRASLARHALQFVLAELVDAGKLNKNEIKRLEKKLRFHDPELLLLEPTKHPHFIRTIPGWREIENYKEWCEKVHEQNLTNDFNGDSIILAEHTRLMSLVRERPEETRAQFVTIQQEADLDKTQLPGSLFANEPDLILEEYSSIEYSIDPIPIIIRNDAFKFDTLGSTWLAINPTIASQLGWNLSDEGFFRWFDSNGKIMVESIWWRDNLIENAGLHLYNVVGEGWLVVASEMGLNLLNQKFKSLNRIKYIERRCMSENGDVKRFTLSEEKS